MTDWGRNGFGSAFGMTALHRSGWKGERFHLTPVTDELPFMTTKRFAMRLKRLRAERKMSQANLAEKSGVSREYIARLELDQQDPTLGTLEKLAKASR